MEPVTQEDTQPKSKSPMFILVGVIALITLLIAFRTAGTKTPVAEQSAPPVTVSADQNSTTLNPKDLNEFPTYPGGTFVKKEGKTYTWNTPDSKDQVLSWYRKNQSGSKWDCSQDKKIPDASKSALECTNKRLAATIIVSTEQGKTTLLLLKP